MELSRLDNPKNILLIQIGKDERNPNKSYYAGFDEKGEYVHIQITPKKSKNILNINCKESFNEKQLLDFGFDKKKIWSIEDEQEKEYFFGRKIQVDNKCHCLIPVDLNEDEVDCNKKDCLQPTKIQFLDFSNSD